MGRKNAALPKEPGRAYFILSILKSRMNERNNPEITLKVPVYTKVTCKGSGRLLLYARSRKVLCKYALFWSFLFRYQPDSVSLHTEDKARKSGVVGDKACISIVAKHRTDSQYPTSV